MATARNCSRVVLTLFALTFLAATAMAADPGLPYPPEAEMSDQKAGSVLIYNLYTSSAASSSQNSRVAVTNTSGTSAAFVHMFMIDGATCSVADSFICLTTYQTSTFLASEMDPGITGYIIMIAVDGVLGCPANFNFLVGDVFVKFTNGLHGNLAAEAVAAVADIPAICDETSQTANLVFDGVSYNRLPLNLAVDNFPSPNDGFVSRVWVNRIGGSLLGTTASVGTLFGRVFNDAENGLSFSVGPFRCQGSFSIDNDGIRTTPPILTHIPATTSGWITFTPTPPVIIGITGCILTGHPNAATVRNAFNGGRNLHKLSFAPLATLTQPIFAPTC